MRECPDPRRFIPAPSYEIVIRRYAKQGKDGDRAPKKTSYFDYEVVLIRDDGVEMVVQRYDGYDSFMTSIRDDQYGEACAYADGLRTLLHARNRPDETFLPQIVSQTTWVKQPPGNPAP